MNNPAARLHSILSQVYAYKGKGNPSIAVWASIFKVPADDIPLVNYKVASLFILPNQIQEEVYRCDGVNQALHLKWMEPVNKAIKHSSLSSSINHFADHLTEGAIVSLEHCADMLSTRTFEIAADVVKLGDVRKDLDSLYADVYSSDIDKQVKYYILRHLDLIRNSIRDYEINGVTPIIDSIDAFLGSTRTNGTMAKEAGKSKFGERIIQTVTNAATVIQLITALPQLAEMAHGTYEMVKDAVAGN